MQRVTNVVRVIFSFLTRKSVSFSSVSFSRIDIFLFLYINNPLFGIFSQTDIHRCIACFMVVLSAILALFFCPVIRGTGRLCLGSFWVLRSRSPSTSRHIQTGFMRFVCKAGFDFRHRLCAFCILSLQSPRKALIILTSRAS